MGIMNPLVLKYLPAVLSVITLCLFSYGLGKKIESAHTEKVKAEFAQYQTAQSRALADAVQKSVNERDAQAAQTQEIERNAIAKASADEAVIADLHVKYDRLRIARPHCPGSSAVPEAGDSGKRFDSPTEREFSNLDGQPFVEFAKRAERVRGQLVSCQAILRTLQ